MQPKLRSDDETRESGIVPRSSLFILGLSVAAALLLNSSASADPAAKAGPGDDQRRPNIVLIVADDLGYAELGCYGQKWIKTTTLDRIAAEGIRFTQFYSGNAVCAPSRCCLMTGKHPGHAHVRDNGDPQLPEELRKKYGHEFPGQHPIPDAEVTIAEMLKSGGYASAAIGKWGLGHFGTSGDPNRQGFELFYGFNCQRHAHNHYPNFLWRNDQKEMLAGNDRTLSGDTYSQDKFIEAAAAFIRQHREQPFFLYLPFTIPHLSIQVPDSSLAEYTSVIPEEAYEHKGYLKHPNPRAGYAAMITHMDRGIGQILELLDELNLDEQTIVMFSSDNGPTYDRLGGSDSVFFNSAGELRGFKGSLYEGGIRVPLVARWPGRIPGGRTTGHLAAFWDFLPTIGELAHVEVPAGVDGVSFAPTLFGQDDTEKRHEFLYWEFPSYGGQQAVRTERWKAIRQNMLRPRNNEPLKTELYDLASDISETTDVAAKHPDVVAQLEAIMQREHTPSEKFPFAPLDQRAAPNRN